MKKVKKIVSMLTIGILNITNNVFAKEGLISPMYGIPEPVKEPTWQEKLLEDGKILIALPLILIIGIIIYFKKVKGKNKEKEDKKQGLNRGKNI